MKILSSSPYATFNPKEWNSVKNNINKRISNNPVKVQKKYFKTFRKVEFAEIIIKNKEIPNQVQQV